MTIAPPPPPRASFVAPASGQAEVIVPGGQTAVVGVSGQAGVAITQRQGPSGPPGPPGPASDFQGFGYAQYVGAVDALPLQVPAATLISVGMPPDAGQTLDFLRGPFVGWNFWSGSILNARAVGDVYLLRLTVTATSPVQGGGIAAQALVNGATIPVDTAHCPLTAPAGQPQVLTFRFELVPKQTFVAGGAGLFLMSSVPLTLLAQKLVVAPLSAG